MKKTILILLTLCLLLLCAGAAHAQELRVDFYNVGKADAMLITTPQGQRILIDTATNAEGKKLAKRLVQEGIETIDLLIITHFDKDHVGGADQIFDKMKVGSVFSGTNCTN